MVASMIKKSPAMMALIVAVGAIGSSSPCEGPRTLTWDMRGMCACRCDDWPPFAQVKKGISAWIVMVCKTVGLAYVGSNPTPATIKLAGQTRSRGPGLMRCGSGLGTAPRAGHLGYGPCSGWSGRCERGERLAALGSVAVARG